MPVFEMESDNDFQGFTNASAYKDRHLKLVQGKNSLSTVTDEDEFATEQSGDEQEGSETPKKANISSKVVSDVQDKVPVEETVLKDGDESKNHCSVNVEQEVNADQSFTSSHEEDDIHNEEEHSPEKVDNDGHRTLPKEDALDEGVRMEEEQQCNLEEQENDDGRKVAEELEVVEDGQENANCENEGNEGGNEEEQARDLVMEGNENNERVNEQMGDCDADEGENLATEHGEPGMEGNEREIEENVIEETEGVLEETEGELEGEEYHEVEEGMEEEGMMCAEVTETEAAVNALKGIMALQPTEILGLPEPDFDYDNDYVEYFDGGVYEDEDDDDRFHSMDQGEEEDAQEMTEEYQDHEQMQENADQDVEVDQDGDAEQEEIHRGDSSQEDEGETNYAEQEEEEETQHGVENADTQSDQAEKNICEQDQPEESSKDKQPDGKSDNEADKEKNLDARMKGRGFEENNDALSKDNDTNSKRYVDLDESNATTSEANSKSGVSSQGRKSKRTKRGLERELEQLDYWGRRQERDAKRRRRTISSKLLGAIEEAEYLTWADLLRSFVPAALLNANLEDKKKEQKSENSLNPSGVSDTNSQRSAALPDASSQSKNDLSKDNVQETDKNSDSKELTSSKDTQEKTDTEKTGDAEVSPVENKSPPLDKDTQEDPTTTGKEKMGNGVAEETQDQHNGENAANEKDLLKQQREEIILSTTSPEEAQVQAFLLKFESNGGILHLLQQFLKVLMKRHKYVWPISAAKVFMEVYPRVRNHVFHGNPWNPKENSQRLRNESLLALTHWEICCSIYQSSKLNTPISESRSMLNPFSKYEGLLEDDIYRLVWMLGRGDIWQEEAPQFHTRLQWLQSQIRLVRGQPEEAAYYLELLLGDLSHLASEGNKEYCCTRARVESDNVVVCYSEVKRQLNVLQRSHMLEQVVDNYTDGRYRVVADLLTTIFHEPLPKSRPGVTLPTRQTQLAILADSLYKLSEYKDVIYWGSFSLTEALMRYNRAEAEEEKNRWAKTLMKITDTMNTMLINDITILMSVDRERLSEIVGTLIRMLVVQLEKPQSTLILPFETLTPWMLLHRILSHEESFQAAEVKKVDTSPRESDGQTPEVKVSDAVNGEKDTEDNENTKKADISSSTTSNPQGMGSVDQKAIEPAESKGTEVATSVRGPLTPYPSTLFLITAHDELGKHSWCCSDDGIFLLYCLDVLLVELRRPLDSQHRVLLHHTLEQVTFCLYSHPSKKSKHKHLRDHGVPQIAFCWERAMQLYQYYRPNVLPDFQTSQIPSITDDAAVLFRRIIALLPDEAKPDDQTQGVEAYINGEVAECNYSPFAPPTDIISDCFYLLGDYYFKNKEWQNAIKYYKLDLSINKERLESWAPLGLSMKAMLETQLNSCEVIEDEEAFFSLAKAAVQCLRQALKLDQYHTNLWVEFGGLVYMVHSHASRLLKQELNPDISLETFDMLEKFKNEMLDLAENCFTRALTIQEDGYEEGLPDERWLHCYMLGKVSEKKGRPPQTIIQYYLKAANYLHNIRAKYPTRINYNSPQEFSVEALEMYYRIHAFVLKYLHQREGRDVDPVILDTFTKCLDELETSSFATCREKRNTSGTDAKGDDFLSGDTPSKKRSLEDVSDIEPPAKKHLSDVGGNEDKSATKEEMQIADDKQDSKVPVEIKKDPVDKDKKESDDEIQVVEEKVIEKKDHYTIVSRCLAALRMCLSRFQEHYKTMYRLAHYYHVSKFHKDNNKAQNYLLGCHLWQNVGYMPVNGLFNERKVWIQQPKNSNFFHGVWRIPNDEIDRPGSFAAHMYRCVSLILDILPQMKDFFMILQIALALKNSPDKDKKYLRDNERELLSEHATQVGLQTMKDKFKVMFKGPAPVNSNRHLRFLLDVYKCYKQVSKHLPGSEPHFAKMLTDAYAAYKSIKVENRSNVLREADSFCNRHQYLAHRAPINNPANVRNPLSNTGSGGLPPPVARRGRPPLTGRGRGRGRGSVYSTTSRTVGDMLAVQQAYKIYESLISTQTLLNKKDLGQVQVYNYQKQLESYQTQLMKYLQIPCVAHYFQASLQGLGTTSTKLPPPRPNQSGGSSAIPNRGNEMVSNSTISPVKSSSVSVVSSTPPSGTSGSSSIAKPDQQRASLSALAARSHAHGISITSVSGTKGPSTQSQPLKPNMSVTVSPVKSSGTPSVKSSGTPTVKGCDISVVSVSQTSPVKTTSASVSPSKTETTKLSLPASTTVKPISPSQGSVSFKTGSSVQVTNPPSSTEGFSTFKAITSLAGGSTTIKPSSSSGTTTLSVVSTSSGGSTTIKTITSGTTVTTAFKPVTSLAGSTTLSKVNPSSSVTAFKSSTSGSTVPKLPAGTTLTRPREISSEKVSVSREHLQASGRPAKSNLESVIPSSSMPSSKPSDSSSLGRTHSGLSSKPSLPKDMTITPAPRVKTQARQAIAPVRPVNSPSTSFFRAFEASLGLNSSKSVPEKSSAYSKSRGGSSMGSRPISQSQTTSVSSAQGRVTQLTPQELLQLAYRSESHGQLSLSHVPNSGGHKQSTSTTSPYSGQYTKTTQQLRAQAKPTSSSTSSPASTLTGLQSSGHKTTPQQLGTQQQISSQQSSRPAQPSSSVSQVNIVNKSRTAQPSSSVSQVNVANKSRTAQPSSSVSQVNVANKPNTSKKPSDSSDDIITLD
ncbi:calcineurin-binding protein cabin-1-like [Macrobrachium nipponense]|uniref:calcineurin-binding protein cabin-1-like n=1 Tax=Macrobrachium nipponense TaxID=159736 RepID=UPI0030C8486D